MGVVRKLRDVMKPFIALFRLLFALVICLPTVLGFVGGSSKWMYCPSSEDPDNFMLRVQSVVIDPETVERGKPFTFAITGNFGTEGQTTYGATAQVTILYDLGKKVSDAQAGQMRVKGLDVEQLEKHTSLRIIHHERPIGTV